jgi:hypothetical protein
MLAIISSYRTYGMVNGNFRREPRGTLQGVRRLL